jgi:TRAP-type uncharacterized transport system substrate-binding protein
MARRIVWKSIGPIVGVCLLLVAAHHYVKTYHPPTVRLRCSGRNASAASTELARKIIAEVHAEDIELELVAAKNSREICTAVEHRLLDVGVVLGGFPPGKFANVRQVASLGVEPLHLVVRGDLADGDRPTIESLRSARVYLGEHGSNGAALAEDLLQFIGFSASDEVGAGDFEAMYGSEEELLAQIRAFEQALPEEREGLLAKLPDAVFLVGSVPAPIVDGLVKSAGYRLLPLPYATALHLDERRALSQDRPVENSRIESIIIPAYTYGAVPACPAKSSETIGLRLLLIAHKDVPASSIERLLTALDKGSFHGIHADFSVTTTAAEFPLHYGAVSYLASQRPFSMNDVMQNLTNAFSMVGAFSAGAFALWSYFRGLRVVSPQYYLQQIDRI